jgi:hypothetical protein
MTAYAIDLPAPVLERRRAPRFRFSFVMPATLSRGDALIQDISAEGARVMHFSALPLGSIARLVFFYAGRRFAANARVLASRVVGLKSGPAGETSYQTRVQFVDTPAEAAETLMHIIAEIESGRHDYEGTAARYFTRCRLRGRSWTKCWTRDQTQPDDGFTVPAKLSDGEIALLCEAYEKMDDDGRTLIRVTAAEAA